MNVVLDLLLVCVFVRIDVGQFIIKMLINESFVWFANCVQLFKELMH